MINAHHILLDLDGTICGKGDLIASILDKEKADPHDAVMIGAVKNNAPTSARFGTMAQHRN